jgi:membrane protease YdiL (CAAX protease family)
VIWQELRELLRSHLAAYFAKATLYELACVALAAGVGEELLFRGFLLEALTRHLDADAWGGWLPLVLSSLMFGVVHYVSGTYLVLATLVGAYLGLMVIVSGSLWVPMTTHAVYDFVALIYLQRDWRRK